ncbi:MAG: hypothetical protein JRN22_01745, partial [Nitrososphaerota archaeon]|nr:hypothetical protein [Nitrososphaerota archaeon]
MEKELWGRKFRIVNHGLDEAEVSAFVNSVTRQDNGLVEKMNHLDSLVNNLEDRDNNLAQRLEQLQSLFASLTDQFNNFLEKLEQPQSLVRPADNTTAGDDNGKLEPFCGMHGHELDDVHPLGVYVGLRHLVPEPVGEQPVPNIEQVCALR